MRLQLIEHDPEDFSRSNISLWAAGKGYQMKHTYVCNGEELPPLNTFDWLMVMGGSQHAWDEHANPWLRKEKLFLSEVLKTNMPVLGICFGAQLLAEALGGRVFPNLHKEIGWYEVTLNRQGRESFLFQNIPSAFVTFHWHGDHFSLPESCAKLAGSKATEIQAFVCSERPLAGLQFHPEYTRDMVRHAAQEYGQDWVPELFVSGRDAVLTETLKMPDTYWLMEALLNNMEQAFAALRRTPVV
jgi:GMP synthase-like glutamine amidotransferase